MSYSMHDDGHHGTGMVQTWLWWTPWYRDGYEDTMAMMNFMVQAWLWWTSWYRHGYDERHGTDMAMMNFMVQAWLWWTSWYRHGYDERHGTDMAMMNFMVQAWLWWTSWYRHGYDELHGTGMAMMNTIPVSQPNFELVLYVLYVVHERRETILNRGLASYVFQYSNSHPFTHKRDTTLEYDWNANTTVAICDLQMNYGKEFYQRWGWLGNYT